MGDLAREGFAYLRYFRSVFELGFGCSCLGVVHSKSSKSQPKSAVVSEPSPSNSHQTQSSHFRSASCNFRGFQFRSPGYPKDFR